jgi:hypothetical protein
MIIDAIEFRRRVLTVLILSMLFLAPTTMAWGENTHAEGITGPALDRADQDSPIMRTIEKHPDAFWAGLIDPDKTVVDYWVGYPFTIGKSYQDTHKANYYEECKRRAGSERELAFCYGSEVHGIEDSYSHNLLIPMRIKQTGMPNIVIHPITELVVDGVYFTPQIQQIYTLSVLEEVDPVTGRSLIEFGNSIWGRDMTSRVKLLSKALGSETSPGLWGGYGLPVQQDSNLWSTYQGAVRGDIRFAVPMLLFSILIAVVIWKKQWKWYFEIPLGFFGVILFLLGLVFLIGIANMGTAEYATPYIEQAEEAVVMFLNYGVGPTMDPSGADALKKADGPLFIIDLIVIGTVVVLGILGRRVIQNIKRRKK